MRFCNLKVFRKVIFIILLISVCATKAQRIRGFGNISFYYENEDFKKELMTDLGGGVEFEFHPLFKPEVSVSYSIMGIKDIKEYDYVQNSRKMIQKDVSSLNFTIGPKIYLWYQDFTSDNAACWYYIIPKINMSRITANQSYNFIDDNNSSKSFNEKSKIADWQHSFCFTIGMEYPLSEDGTSSLAISVNATNINLGKTLNRFPHNEVDYSTIGYGIGLTYYFGF
ncbi:hypothetical protein [Flavobacterium sp. HTF]|uniref:hypothetical protein n=1 Tax=Flavobacterium sp. HTF TaxID=2170732 RepID=UPI000D5EC5E4|nr:hypothetical protein [Flavobacterium sp. HTF]PWB19438.1 hypothetical protein DCO46_21495 [Flavobacterium sp. HTF]